MKKQILLIGIGQLGSSVADHFAIMAKKENLPVHVLAVDTDIRSQESIYHAQAVSMAHMCKLSDVLAALDTENLKAWFPCRSENDCVEYFENLSMSEGSNQWRMKALLAFNYFLSLPRSAALLHAKLDAVIEAFGDASGENNENPENNEGERRTVELYTVASLAGGTGSGLFIPLAYYIKRYFKEHGISCVSANALLVLPDICEDLLTPEQKVKAQANTYAAMRELNAITLASLGRDVSFSMKIGSASDPYMGLLYDSESEDAKLPESRPFEKVYLFRRVPGIQSITPHIDILANAARTICTEDTLAAPSGTDAIYGGFSLSKTVYPRDCIAEYISLRSLYDAATSQWMPLYESTTKELARMRSASLLSGGTDFTGNAGDLVTAILCDGDDEDIEPSYDNDNEDEDMGVEESFSLASLDEDDNSVETYKELILESIDLDLRTPGIEALEAFAEETEKESNTKGARKIKGKKLRESLLATVKQSREWLAEYYTHGLYIIKEEKDLFEARLGEDGSEISIKEKLLKNGETAVSPVTALARLAHFYRALERSIPQIRSKIADIPLTEDRIPKKLLAADARVHMDCKYDVGGDRLVMLFEGQTSHIGAKHGDKALFCYDIKSAYLRIRDRLRAARIESALEIVGEQIKAYYSFLTALSTVLEEYPDRLDVALRRQTGTAGSTYYVGASVGERKHFYLRYTKFLEDKLALKGIAAELDTILGEGALAQLFKKKDPCEIEDEENKRDPQRELEECAGTLLDELRAILHAKLLESDFYKKEIDRNILKVLLTQSSQHGGDDSELALRKAFLARVLPIRYTVPETRDDYVASRAIKSRVSALIPSSAREFIIENPDMFGNLDPEAAINELLFRTGEYDGVAGFGEFLPANELVMQRESMEIRLSFIEPLCEHSESPIYYKSYNKSLMMREQQLTEMWNPHLVRGIPEESKLPLIAPITDDEEKCSAYSNDDEDAVDGEDAQDY